VQSFLGFCNFYRCFIHGFTGIAQPLTELTGLAPFEWMTHRQGSFDVLWTALTITPILVLLTNEDPYQLEADASAYAVGTTLSQRPDSIWRPITFMSKALSLTQHNYKIYDQELLVIMIALGDFCRYLVNVTSLFEVWMDHANLQYFKKLQKLNRRQARWLTKLQDYCFTLHHVTGKTNSWADILSRWPGYDKGEQDNEEVTLLTPDLFSAQEVQVRLVKLRGEMMDQICQEIARNHRTSFEEDAPSWAEDDGIWTFQGRVFIPEMLREQAIQQHHNSPMSGHCHELSAPEGLFLFLSFVPRQSRTLDSMYYQKPLSHAGEVTTVTWASHSH
jgi:hypothetical protein